MVQRFTKIFFAAIFLIFISSCEKKSCKNVSCPAGKTCYEGACVCPDGYEGSNCDTLSSTKYIGNWNVSENCGNSQSPFQNYYPVYIQAGNCIGSTYNTANVIVISAFFGQGPLCVQIVNTSPGNQGNTLVIPPQTVGTVSVASSQGYYTYSNGAAQIVITLNYTANSFNYTCQETLYKQ